MTSAEPAHVPINCGTQGQDGPEAGEPRRGIIAGPAQVAV